jgi:UDP-glucuronate 4-epimerase
VPADNGTEKPGGSKSPHAIYNLGNEISEPVRRLVEAIETACGRKAVTELVPMQPGDVEGTHADIDVTRRNLGFSPRIGLDAGIARFVDWFRRYYAV